MKNIRNALGTIVVLVLYIIQVAEAKPKEKFALVIHGAAGTILKKKQAHYRTCRKFELTTKDAVIVETDGEQIGVPPVKYTILPQALKIII